MRFLTGSERIPPTGLLSRYKVFFKHDCPGNCKCFPTVSTCGYVISLPVHVDNYEEFFKMIEVALKCEPGFGRI